MIAFVEGTLVEKHPTRVVVNVQGLGYELFIPLSSYDRLPPLGQTVHLLTHEHIREDDHRLFGFMTEAERRMFLLLTSISGIGPKLALCALSGMTVRELKRAIVENDVKRLSSVSGIGRKTGERIIVELRDKLDAGEALEAVAGAGEQGQNDARLRDAAMALIALGYKQDQAAKMVLDVLHRHPGQELTVEDIIKKSLGG
jgi:Holliday junction DNA helicase RuvA